MGEKEKGKRDWIYRTGFSNSELSDTWCLSKASLLLAAMLLCTLGLAGGPN